MQKKIRFLLLVALYGLVGPVLAAVQADALYEAEVAVSGQSVEQRTEAIRDALAEVFIKVSGDRSAPLVLANAGMLERATQFVQQFQYRTVDTPPEAGLSLVPEQKLWVRFDASAVDKALRQHGIRVWGRVRPSTLLWVALEQDGGRYLAGANALHETPPALEARAQRRGLPVLLPLLDLEDQSRLSVADVWGNFGDNILKASARYQPEAVLVARVYHGLGEIWHGRWTLYIGGAPALDWSDQATTRDELLNVGIDQAADLVAQQFAQITSDAQINVLQVSVKDVASLVDYAVAARYLQSLASVVQAEAVSLEPTGVTFRVELRGDRRGLEQAIALGRTLIPVAAQGELAAGAESGRAAPLPNELVYRFVP